MKLVKLLANLGYGSRKDVTRLIRNGWLTRRDGSTVGLDDAYTHEDLLVDDEPIDPAQGVLILLNKPIGYTCSTKDPGRVVYDLLPERFRYRNPVLSTVGRLDRDTSGLLMLTDDGQLLHRIISPKAELPKVYEVELAEDLRGDEAALFAAGTLLLESETTPLAPAVMETIDARHARLTLIEGRYHQVRRMFAATGNRVLSLHRSRTGNLDLSGLEPGQWRIVPRDEAEAKLFA
ncbi:16S rRNA pseudouridine(516) synthase [Arenimonas sp. GDDSR-1]|uniref:pseudouridine synthase n=1 Tax=Arenimonas sp. GDDSR-1 TaxID=2950125 RepID=UPI002621CB76|nr:16S rRNA pseudouridine(516) synthase [Arenimonas sp. GDDSR-1]